MTQRAAIEGVEISGLTCDSRSVAPGTLFAAIPGTNVDGRDFMDDAASKGAAALLAPLDTDWAGDIPLLQSRNTRLSYALMASRFFDRQPETIAAITGTNGKTSVASFVRQIWQQLGSQSASIGTLGIASSVYNNPEGLTTPDPVDLHQSLANLATQGIEKLAMEASSHGLSQYRLDGVRVSLAAFTNLSRDHLDYHDSMQEYLDAKLRLFSEILIDDGVAVLNADEDVFEKVKAATRALVLSYGRAGEDIRLVNVTPSEMGQHLDLNVMGKEYSISLPLSGAFQAENALCALGVVIADGAEMDQAVSALENLQGVPGRLQLIATTSRNAGIYVDYAHTPDALANVLKAMRPHATGQLNVVFGCGGDRDAGKRPEMGWIACDLADDVIVTDDNPRGEEPARIRAQILEACPNAREIGDRAKAIECAISELQAGDVLVVAGKGHETGQTVKGEVFPFDDAEEILKVIGEGRA